MRKLVDFNVLFFSLTTVIGFVGNLLFAFDPSAETLLFAKYSSYVIFPYAVVVGVVYLLKNRSKMAQNIKMFRSNFKFYFYVFIGYPLLALVISYSNYLAMSNSYPYLFHAFAIENEPVQVEIVKKRLWGRGYKNEEVTITGFSKGFPVSREYYNSVIIGQKVSIGVSKSVLGSAFEFKMP